jgi:membrane protein involved in colicin uptake
MTFAGTWTHTSQRLAEEATTGRLADEETNRLTAEVEAKTLAEVEADRLSAEAEAKRLSEEEEYRMKKMPSDLLITLWPRDLQ